MHRKFGLNNDDRYASTLSPDEYRFRIKAMFEELIEYMDPLFPGDSLIALNTYFDNFVETTEINIPGPNTVEDQFDALIDLVIFALGTAERQGMNNFKDGFARVMSANMQKELAGTSSNSKRSFARDLVKPPGWRAPYLCDLIAPSPHCGLIILEGPDHSGKTTLAEHFRDKYGAHVMHCTWSPELEKNMSNYIINTLSQGIEISKNQLVIIDRSWISEYIYSDVFRNGTQYPHLADYCHKTLRVDRAEVVYCLPYDIPAGIEAFNVGKNSREEMYNNNAEVYRAYESLWNGVLESSYTFKNSTYADAVSLGLCNKYKFTRYDYMQDPIDNFADNFISSRKTFNKQAP